MSNTNKNTNAAQVLARAFDADDAFSAALTAAGCDRWDETGWTPEIRAARDRMHKAADEARPFARTLLIGGQE